MENFTKVKEFYFINVVPWFQQIIDDIIEHNNCKGMFAYLSNIPICGKTKEEHNANLQYFLEVATKHNFTFIKNKYIYFSDGTLLLGYQIYDHTLLSDTKHVKILLDIPVPKTRKELGRVQLAFMHIRQNGCLASLVK